VAQAFQPVRNTGAGETPALRSLLKLIDVHQAHEELLCKFVGFSFPLSTRRGERVGVRGGGFSRLPGKLKNHFYLF
jgi:hypothetical protein